MANPGRASQRILDRRDESRLPMPSLKEFLVPPVQNALNKTLFPSPSEVGHDQKHYKQEHESLDDFHFLILHLRRKTPRKRRFRGRGSS